MIWIQLPGISVHAAVSGKGAQSLVLIHELGGSLNSFDAVAAQVEDGFRILRYDQRGAGLSEKPRACFTIADHVTDLHGVLAGSRLPPPYLLAGVAAGAAVAVAYALAWPGAVAGLLLCSPTLSVAPERRHLLATRAEAAARDGMRAVVDATLDRSYPVALRGDEAAFAAYRARFLANDPVAYGHANMALADAGLDQSLARLRLPCQVLAGQHDPLRPPAEVASTAANIHGARCAVVESGHLMAVQAPGAVAAALRALQTRISEASPA